MLVGLRGSDTFIREFKKWKYPEIFVEHTDLCLQKSFWGGGGGLGLRRWTTIVVVATAHTCNIWNINKIYLR